MGQLGQTYSLVRGDSENVPQESHGARSDGAVDVVTRDMERSAVDHAE